MGYVLANYSFVEDDESRIRYEAANTDVKTLCKIIKMIKKNNFKKGQVVLDNGECSGEYVNFIKYSLDFPGSAFVFNPRCGEKYWTKIKSLTKKELGNYIK